MVIKSAVAFFFLFFLHGTSIGNGQQGISYNGSRALLCCGKVSQNFKFKNNINKYKPNIELCPIPQ